MKSMWQNIYEQLFCGFQDLEYTKDVAYPWNFYHEHYFFYGNIKLLKIFSQQAM